MSFTQAVAGPSLEVAESFATIRKYLVKSQLQAAQLQGLTGQASALAAKGSADAITKSGSAEAEGLKWAAIFTLAGAGAGVIGATAVHMLAGKGTNQSELTQLHTSLSAPAAPAGAAAQVAGVAPAAGGGVARADIDALIARPETYRPERHADILAQIRAVPADKDRLQDTLKDALSRASTQQGQNHSTYSSVVQAVSQQGLGNAGNISQQKAKLESTKQDALKVMQDASQQVTNMTAQAAADQRKAMADTTKEVLSIESEVYQTNTFRG